MFYLRVEGGEDLLLGGTLDVVFAFRHMEQISGGYKPTDNPYNNLFLVPQTNDEEVPMAMFRAMQREARDFITHHPNLSPDAERVLGTITGHMQEAVGGIETRVDDDGQWVTIHGDHVFISDHDHSALARFKVTKGSGADKLLQMRSEPLPKLSADEKNDIEKKLGKAEKLLGSRPAFDADEHAKFRWEVVHDRIEAIREYVHGNVLQGFYDGKYGSVITNSHESVYLKNGGLPVGSGHWMGWPETSWGVTKAQWASMTMRERASIEVREQMKYVPVEYEEELSTYKGKM